MFALLEFKFKPGIMIMSENYTIRLLQLSDSDHYFTLIDNNRKRLEDFFVGTVANTKTPAEAQLFLADLLNRAQLKMFYPYGIFESASGRLIGYIHVFNFDWSIPKAEIGFFVDTAFAGQGVMSKALQDLVTYYFKDLGFNKLSIRTHETNTASCRLAEKCGFEQEGTIRCDYKTTSGKLVDLIYYGHVKQGADRS
jgi:ribosomal-protein-serine acetyltransferase